MTEKEACQLCRGAGFVTYRDGIAYETHDVEREEHLIEDCPECQAKLDAMTIDEIAAAVSRS